MDAAVATLLALKAKFKELTGEDVAGASRGKKDKKKEGDKSQKEAKTSAKKQKKEAKQKQAEAPKQAADGGASAMKKVTLYVPTYPSLPECVVATSPFPPPFLRFFPHPPLCPAVSSTELLLTTVQPRPTTTPLRPLFSPRRADPQ